MQNSHVIKMWFVAGINRVTCPSRMVEILEIVEIHQSVEKQGESDHLEI